MLSDTPGIEAFHILLLLDCMQLQPQLYVLTNHSVTIFTILTKIFFCFFLYINNIDKGDRNGSYYYNTMVGVNLSTSCMRD